jgi:hypothetical protein
LVFATNKKTVDREPLHDGEVSEELALAVASLRNMLMQLTDADMGLAIGAPRAPSRPSGTAGAGRGTP